MTMALDPYSVYGSWEKWADFHHMVPITYTKGRLIVVEWLHNGTERRCLREYTMGKVLRGLAAMYPDNDLLQTWLRHRDQDNKRSHNYRRDAKRKILTGAR